MRKNNGGKEETIETERKKITPKEKNNTEKTKYETRRIIKLFFSFFAKLVSL